MWHGDLSGGVQVAAFLMLEVGDRECDVAADGDADVGSARVLDRRLDGDRTEYVERLSIVRVFVLEFDCVVDEPPFS